MAVNSISSQSFEDWRLIVVDDYSNDSSLEIVSKVVNPTKLKIIRLEKNSGVGAAFKAGVDSADSKYIARIDSDDISFVNRLTVQVKILEAFKELNALSTPMLGIDSRNRTTGIFSWNNLNHLEVDALLPLTNVINNPTTFFRIESIVGKLSETSHDVAEDYFTWLKYHGEFRWAILKDPLLYWRRHDKNMSRHGYSFGLDFLNYRESNLQTLGIQASQSSLHIINGTKVIESKLELMDLLNLKSQLKNISESISYQYQLQKVFDRILISSLKSKNREILIKLICEVSTKTYIDFFKKRFHISKDIG